MTRFLQTTLVRRFACIATGALLVMQIGAAYASEGFLEGIHRHVMLTSTVPENGDLNPYAVVVAPVSAGRIRKDDVLIDNFNNLSNLQGTGTTILDYNPETKTTSLVANLPQHAPHCPGGTGLTTAMTMLTSGWIIVGNTPSSDGTTKTRGDGCLFVLDPNGQIVTAWTGGNINGPWGNIALLDKGTTASLFVSMAGSGVPGPDVRDPATGIPVVLRKASVVRFDLSIPQGQPPSMEGQTVVADGFGHRADRDAFLIGPTGLALAGNGSLYVSDAVENRIVEIPDAIARKNSAGTGRVVTSDGLLKRPLAVALLPTGHLLVCNAKNGQVVEIDPATGKQLAAQWVDTDAAQSPPGNGDLFGLAVTPDGKGFYYVEDDMNTLMEASP